MSFSIRSYRFVRRLSMLTLLLMMSCRTASAVAPSSHSFSIGVSISPDSRSTCRSRAQA